MLVTARTHSAFIGIESQNPAAVQEFMRFRKALFVDRLGWDLRTEGGQESDEFDGPNAMYCVLYDTDGVVGGWRAIRADEPYLAATVFPCLSQTKPYPRDRSVWEISRFGVLSCSREAAGLAASCYGLMFQFAMEQGAKALVAVVDLTHERLLKRFGIRTRRYGPPSIVGVDRKGRPLSVVAGEIPIKAQAAPVLQHLLAATRNVEIIDEALVLRPASIPA